MCMNTSSLQVGDFFQVSAEETGWAFQMASETRLSLWDRCAFITFLRAFCRPTVLLRCSTLLLSICCCCCCVMRSKSKVLPWTCKGNGEGRKEKRARVLGPSLRPHSFQVCTSSCNKRLIILFQQPFLLIFPNQCKECVPSSSEDLAPQKIYSLASPGFDHQFLPLTWKIRIITLFHIFFRNFLPQPMQGHKFSSEDMHRRICGSLKVGNLPSSFLVI